MEIAKGIFLTAMFFSGIFATTCYFRIESRLASVGEPGPRFFYTIQDIFKTLRRYEDLAAHNSWPNWLPLGCWIGLGMALLFGLMAIYLT